MIANHHNTISEQQPTVKPPYEWYQKQMSQGIKGYQLIFWVPRDCGNGIDIVMRKNGEFFHWHATHQELTHIEES